MPIYYIFSFHKVSDMTQTIFHFSYFFRSLTQTILCGTNKSNSIAKFSWYRENKSPTPFSDLVIEILGRQKVFLRERSSSLQYDLL